MKYFIIILFLLPQVACRQNSKEYTATILERDVINAEFFQSMDEPERALLGWYLFAYGNECTASSQKVKCRLLELLSVENECDEDYVRFLKQWFDGDIYMKSKLVNCPSIPHDGAIQNAIKKITMTRASDTLTISIKVDGMNNSQEKSWNAEQTDSYIIHDGVFEKLK